MRSQPGGSEPEPSVTGGDVWVSNGLNGVVYRFDPRKKKVVQTVTLPGGADAIAAGENGVWVADKTAGAVVRVDPSTGAAGSPIRVGAGASAVAVGAGAVWVVNVGEGSVSRVDPASGQVTTVSLTKPSELCCVAVGERGVWVTLTGPPPPPY